MNNGFVKNIIIAGFHGGGKIFVMMYIVIYACSKVLTDITVAMICWLYLLSMLKFLRDYKKI